MPRFGLGYAWLPLVSAVVWFGTVLALLIIWLANGSPQYEQSEHTIVYISDIGAKYKPLFIAGAAVTAVFFIATLLADRALRHRNRLPAFSHLDERFSVCAIVFGIIGSIALVLLTILDAFHHDTAHWILTAIFIIAIALNCVFNTLETHYLSRRYPVLRRMRKSRNAKIALITIGIIAAVVMAILMGTCDEQNYGPDDSQGDPRRCNGQDSTAAVLEFVVAFIFAGFLATYVADLRYQDEPLPQLEQEMRAAGIEPKIGNPANPAATAIEEANPIGEANA